MATDDLDRVYGLVISTIDYKESSKIIKLFTRKYGFISLLARGAKRSKSSLQNLTSLYCMGEYRIRKAGDMFILLDGKVLNLHDNLRKEIKDIYLAQIVIKYIQKGLLENQVNEDLFDMVDKFLDHIPKHDMKIRLLNMFLIKYISFLGYKPSIFRCPICSKEIGPDAKFSIGEGGLICDNHKQVIAYRDKHLAGYIKFILYSTFEELDLYKEKIDEKSIVDLLVAYVYEQVQIREDKDLSYLIKMIN